MPGILLEVQKKISGVKNTRKITKAMQLVAASKMRQFQRRAIHARHYVLDLLEVLSKNLEPGFKSEYTEKRAEGATLFVLYTSDKGLCGPLNNKLIQSLFRSNAWNDLAPDERRLITIGKKSFDFARSNKIPVTKHYVAVPEKLSNLDAIRCIDGILDMWKKEGLKKVVFVAPHYKNSFTFYPVLKTFLPFGSETIESILGPLEISLSPRSETGESYMLYSPSKKIVLEKLYDQLVHSIFIQSFLELKASEYSSRMIAMQNATDAADRMTQDLSLQYNKARQQAITQEIAELIGASMALSE